MKSLQPISTLLGTTIGREPRRTFGVRQADRLFHLVVYGSTGTGKSTLFLNMIRQDIEAGRGFCLIDPHGDLAGSVAELAGDRAIHWDVADPTSPYGYNPLTFVSAEHRPLVASGLIDALKKQWADAWGPRMEHLLRYALLALLERPQSTLQDLIPLFLDKEFRRQVVAGITDEAVRHFWTQEFTALNYKTTLDGVAPIANKIGALLAHPVVREALCTPDQPLRFRRIMDEGQMVIINLAKGRLGADSANLLGGLIVSVIASAAYSRQGIPEAERRPFYLFFDEFHAATSLAFADLLSELRKYGVALAASTQFSSRIEPIVHEAILGNVGSMIVFRVGANDAAILSRQLAADTPQPRDLVNLPNYEAFMKLMVGGRQERVFSARSKSPDRSFSSFDCRNTRQYE